MNYTVPIVCAWCHATYGHKACATPGITHGLCAGCMQRYFPQAEPKAHP